MQASHLEYRASCARALLTERASGCGAMLFARTYDFLKETVLAWKNYGSISLPGTTGLPAVVFVVVFVGGTLLLFRFLNKKGL